MFGIGDERMLGKRISGKLLACFASGKQSRSSGSKGSLQEVTR